MRRILSLAIILTVFISFSTADAVVKYWYVRPATGEYGAEDGTSYATAWDGLASIVWASVDPGDYVFLDPDNGISSTAGFNNEYTAMTVGGSAGNITTITAYDTSNPPTLNRLQSIPNTGWAGPDGDGCYTLTVSQPYAFFEDSIALGYGYTTDSTLWGANQNWAYSGGVLYYKPTSGTPGSHILTGYGHSAINISTDVDYVTFSHLNFEKMMFALKFPGTTAQLDEITVEDCNFNNVKTAFYVIPDNTNAVNDIIVQRCNFNYVSLGAVTAPAGYGPEQITGVLIDSNTFTYGGIVNSSSSKEWYYATCRYYSGAYQCTNAGYMDHEQISVANSKDVVISNNYISGRTRGIVTNVQSNMYGTNIRINNNKLVDVTYTGIFTTSATAEVGVDHYKDIFINNNLFVNCGNGEGIDAGFYSQSQRAAIQFGGYLEGTGVDFALIVGNTFYGNIIGINWANGYAEHVTAEDNIFYNHEYGGIKLGDDISTYGLDYNLYFSSDSEKVPLLMREYDAASLFDNVFQLDDAAGTSAVANDIECHNCPTAGDAGTWRNTSDNTARTIVSGDIVSSGIHGSALTTGSGGTGVAYVEVNDADIINSGFWYEGAVQIWARPTFAYNVSTYQTLFCAYYSNDNNRIRISYNSTDDKFQVEHIIGGTNVTLQTAAFTSDTDLQKWHHFVLYWDQATNLVDFFVDGVEYSSTSQTGSTAGVADMRVYIGLNYSGAAYNTPGAYDIDEFKVGRGATPRELYYTSSSWANYLTKFPSDDQNSLSTDPVLSRPCELIGGVVICDLSLSPSSPAIDAGIPVDGIHVWGSFKDAAGFEYITGAAPDIGAYERPSGGIAGLDRQKMGMSMGPSGVAICPSTDANCYVP